MANFLHTNGTTWTFDKELTLSGAGGTYQYGSYCNGDYWIIGPVIIISMTPAWNGTYNGAELNCIPDGWGQGLTIPGTSKYSGTYRSSRNVANNIPMTLQPQAALLSSSGHGNCGVYDGDNMWINHAAVLTVLSTPPPTNSFRPGYAGTVRYHRGTEDDIRYDRLARVAPVSGMTSLAVHTGRHDTCQPSHMGHHMTYVTMPCMDGPVGYGANNGGMLGEAVLAANCDFTAGEKRNLVVALIQKGIDMYSIIASQSPGGVCWYPNGGNSALEKLTVLFAGVLLNNATLMNVGARSGDHLYENGGSAGSAPSTYWYFAHDCQTFYVKSADVARGNGYSGGDIGLPEWGIRHSTNPSIDSSSWGASYRRCCTAASWGAGILAVHMMSQQGVNMKGLWNHNVIFDYQDRYLANEPPAWDWFRHPNPSWCRSMWNNYRNAYPPVWPGTVSADTTPPLPPTNLISPQQSDTTIALSWTAGGQASDGDYPVGYRIYRDGVLITSIAGTSYTDTGLVAETEYDYDIYSYDDSGNASSSAASDTYTTAEAAPPTTTVFINGSGDNANNGSSWILARRYLPSTLARGTTYYIGTGNFGAYTFDDAPNSTVITIKKATLADHGSNTGWNNAYAGLAQWGNFRFISTSHIDFLGISTAQTLIQHSTPTPEYQTILITGCSNIRIEYCEIDGMNGGIGNMSCQGINMSDNSDIWIEHNFIHDVADDLIQCYGIDRFYIRWNRLINAHGMVCGIGNGHSDAIELGSTDDCEIIGNFVYGIESTSALITDNWTGNFCDRLFIANNIFYNNTNVWYNVYLDNTRDCKFYNNILWGFHNGNVASDAGLAIEYTNTGMDVRNNIMTSVVTRNGGSWEPGNIGDYNLIYRSPTGYTVGANDIIGVDPQFTNIPLGGSPNLNPVLADFAPLNESAPTVDAGTTIPELSYDIQHYQRPMGTAYDIGPFEYSGAVVATGACCNPATGECEITTESQCNFDWLGAGSICTDCVTPVPTEGLIISYPCGEDAGTYTVNDASGSAVETLLLLPLEGALSTPNVDPVDSTGRHTITNYDSSGNYTPSGYFGGAFHFNGGTNYMRTPDSDDWNLCENVTDNYTIDLFVNHNDHAETEDYLSQFVDDDNHWRFMHVHGEGLRFTLTVNGSVVIQLTGNEIANSDWHHVSLIKVGSDYALYLDGINVARVHDTSVTNFTGSLYIGSKDGTKGNFFGRMDEIRISKDNIFNVNPADVNDSFAIPTEAYSIISGSSTNGDLVNTSNGYADGVTEFTGDSEIHIGEVSLTGTHDGIEFSTVDMQYARGTIAFAMYPTVVDEIPPIAPRNFSERYAFGHTVGNWSNRIQLYIDAGYLHLGMGDNHYVAADVAALSVGTWYHVILTWLDSGVTIVSGHATGSPTGNGQWSIYVDGLPVAAGPYFGLSQLRSVARFGNTGHVTTPYEEQAFEGYLDNLKVYDIPLSPSDAADLAFNDGKVEVIIPEEIDPPVVINIAATDITAISAVMAGEITDTGGEIPNVTIYYGETDEAEVAGDWDSSIDLGATLGTFNVVIGQLTHNTTYYFRCYAENSGGSDWANSSETFDTLEIVAPTITQDAATNIEVTTVTLSGTVTDDGNEEILTVLIYYGDDDAGEVSGDWDDFVTAELDSNGNFSESITELVADTTYFFRMYAENSIGSTWGDATLTFDTSLTGAPTVINDIATEIEDYTARIGGAITDAGDENPTVTIYWGRTDGDVTAGDWEYSAEFGVQTGAFDVLLTDLELATIYYFRCYATNAFGEDWANSTQSFSTLLVLPISPDPNKKPDGFIWGNYDNAYEIVSPYTDEEIFDIHRVSRGDVTYLASSEHFPHKLTRYGDKNWVLEEIDMIGGPFLPENDDEAITVQYVNGTGGTTGNYYNVDNVGTLNCSGDTPFLEEMVGSLFLIKHTRHDNTVETPDNTTHATPTGDGVRCQGDWQFDVSNMLNGDNPNHTAKIWRRAVPGEWQEYQHFSGATLASDLEDEKDVFYTWTANNAAVDGVFTAVGQVNKGIVKITSFISTSSVSVVVKEQVYQESSTSPTTSMFAEGAWNDYRGYPKTVTFFGNRLWWASTTNNPQGLWGSRVGYYEDHTGGVVDDDAVGINISDNDVSSIEWISASQNFMVGSARKEYIISAVDRKDPITPKDNIAKPHSTNGSMPLQPVEIEGGMLYAQRLGYKMLMLYYQYLDDAYDSSDATRLAPHMFKYPAVDMSKQGTPETIVWVTRTDGTLAIFRYSKDEEIAAWSRVVTGSKSDVAAHAFISTTVVAGTTEDRVWTVVEREVDGKFYYYIERFADRNYATLADAMYLDCATTVTADSEGTLNRLYYLEGHTVTVMDGFTKIGEYLITGGQILGLTADTEYVVGLPYMSRMRTMAFAVPGTVTEGSIKRVLNILVRTVRTREGSVGAESHGQTNIVDLDIPYSLDATDVEAFAESGFSKESRVVLDFSNPYPATVLAIVFEVEMLP